MAQGRRASATLSGACLALAGVAALRAWVGVGFAAAPMRARATKAARAAYDSGKVNLGVDLDADVAPPPQPVLECDEGCVTAIKDCLDDGCSVEAMLKLDAKLADDEKEVESKIAALKEAQKTNFEEGNVAMLYWMENFLGRTGSLRAQLQAMRESKDSDFVKQMVKAASVAFGGGRTSDYPKVGVSSYSA
mmetsp:Transcript_52990/g.138102  ORF Transcript_52990/g.138102 Transcript_52990/m.138102 type:complete len:191 (-) Transcript_52990:201-773(-)